jgi:hypothetical protein
MYLHFHKFSPLIFNFLGLVGIPHDHSRLGKLVELFKVIFGDLYSKKGKRVIYF